MSDILKQVNDIFIELLEEDHLILTAETTAEDVEDWDSLNHIHIVVAIEKHFGIRFNSKEIQSWDNVGEMIDSIITKQEPI